MFGSFPAMMMVFLAIVEELQMHVMQKNMEQRDVLSGVIATMFDLYGCNFDLDPNQEAPSTRMKISKSKTWLQLLELGIMIE